MNNQSLSLIIGVLSVGIIITFLVLIYLDYSNYKKLTENSVFPPWPAKCPDYWVSQNDNECKNVNKIGICRTGDSDDVMDFGTHPFKGGKGDFYKCNWAKKCNSPWEGIDSLC